MKAIKLVFAGGGTGGHVMAGLACAEIARTQGSEILFVGSDQGLEKILVPKHGFRLELLQVGKLVGQTWSTRLRTLLQLPLALLNCVKICVEERPQWVVGVGGYSSGPMVLAAATVGRLLGIRSAIIEQNAVSGFTNRFLGQIVDRVFCAFPDRLHTFHPSLVTVTGNPVRASLEVPPLLDIPVEEEILFAFGGSQGARSINDLLIQALPKVLEMNPTLRVIHQTGPRDADRVAEAYRALGLLNRIDVRGFIDDMRSCYEKAGLVVCRAGSSTLSELALCGRGALLIPLPSAAQNHQFHNAQNFQQSGAAVCFDQTKENASGLSDALHSLWLDREARLKLAARAAEQAKPDAAASICKFLLN